MLIPAAIRATFPENWPASLHELSFRNTQVRLGPADVRALGAFNSYVCRHFAPLQAHPLSDALRTEVTEALTAFPDGVMTRLGGCSWKGATLVHEPCKTLGDVMRIITQDDARIGRFLAAAMVAEAPLVLHLRDWHDIPPQEEFRAFVRQGEVIGLSQYYHRSRFPEIAARKTEAEAALRDAVAAVLSDLEDDTVVIDLWAEGLSTGALRKVWLIELNPFGRPTDACLFSWDAPGSFDGRLRMA